MSIKLMTTSTSEDSGFLQLMLPTHGRNLLYSRPTHILIFGVHLSTLSSHVGIIFPGSRNIISFKPAKNGQGQSSQLTELYPSSFRCGKNQCCAKPNILYYLSSFITKWQNKNVTTENDLREIKLLSSHNS